MFFAFAFYTRNKFLSFYVIAFTMWRAFDDKNIDLSSEEDVNGLWNFFICTIAGTNDKI